jgi:hypothetical protein
MMQNTLPLFFVADEFISRDKKSGSINFIAADANARATDSFTQKKSGLNATVVLLCIYSTGLPTRWRKTKRWLYYVNLVKQQISCPVILLVER